MGIVLSLIGLAAIILAVVSLLTPKAAFFLKKKTRLRAFASYLGIAVIGLVAGISSMQAPAEQNQSTISDNTPKVAEPATTEAAPAVATPAEPQKTVELLPYNESEVLDTSTGSRKRGQVFITLADPAAQFTPDQLAATCMAAARYYAEKNGFKALSVFFADIPGDNPWEGTRLAQCDYSPDEGGWSGNNGWLWQNVKAVERPLTDAERQMKKLWGEAKSKGIVRESEIKKYVAKKMGIKPDKVTLLFVFPENVNYKD